MSLRRGYWYLAGEVFDGPFRTIKEAKENVQKDVRVANNAEVTIRTMIVLERGDRLGNWSTVH